MDTMVATGIDTAGLRASSPEVAETYAVIRLPQQFVEPYILIHWLIMMMSNEVW
jgi:hypothetical protein